MRGARLDAGCAALLAVLAMLWFSVSWDRIVDPRDEGYLIVQAERVLSGERPHRDFTDVYGPAALPVVAWMLRSGDGDVLALHVQMGAVRAVAVAIGFAAMRFVAPLPWAMAASLLAIAFWGRFEWNLNTPYASVFTVVLLELALLLALVGRRRERGGWLVAAGLASGLAVLFKQSLALMGGLGLALALLADGMLSPATRSGSRRDRRAAGAVWLLAALAVPVVVARFLSVRDYLLHLAPIHGALAIVWLAVRRRATTPALAGIARRRLLPWAAGAAVAPVAAAATYAGWGALGALVENMFLEPMTRVNYALPVELPSLEGLLPAAIGWAAIGAVALALRDRDEAEGEWARTALPVLFFHLFLCFQFFPRAGPDLHIAQGAHTIALAAAGAAWSRRLAPAGPRRAGVGVLLALPAVALAVPVAHESATIPPGRRLRLPHVEGIALPSGAFDQLGIYDMELLVAWLREREPRDAPVFLLSNEDLVYYASDRPPLFPDLHAELLWVGWNMLPPERIAAFDQDAMIERLRAHPEALVIDSRRYLAAGRKRRAFPRVWAFVRDHYPVVQRIGGYRIHAWRDDDGATTAPDPATLERSSSPR